VLGSGEDTERGPLDVRMDFVRGTIPIDVNHVMARAEVLLR
jgi:hypothetical protein